VVRRILITGAAGSIGTMLRSRLARPDRVLRLLDVTALAPATPGERVELVQASVTDLPALEQACTGVDAVVHLAGYSGERPWADILQVNIDGTRNALEAARRQGVGRFVFASSNHAVGYVPRGDGMAGDDLFPRPDTHYGVGKAAGEALCSLYADRYGMDVICLRIGTCQERPTDLRALATWLSPDDCARLVEACLTVPSPGFRVVWGVSANTRRWWSLEGARSLGYTPRDDAERFAAELVAEHGEPDPADPVHRLVGGPFCSPEFDVTRVEDGR